MLRLESVTKTYNHRGQPISALKETNVDICQGDFVSIVGPSGSGKSTLLLTLGGMLTPSTGRVWFEEHSLYDLSPDERATLRRRKFGFVFQTFNLIPYLSALENVQVPLFLTGWSESEQKQKASVLLEKVGLADRLHHKPGELSVGQQQRVALARVLANEPEVILADEPTGNLDPQTGEQIISFFEQVNQQGLTVVMVTHDMRFCPKAKRTLQLRDGCLCHTSEVTPELDSMKTKEIAVD